MCRDGLEEVAAEHHRRQQEVDHHIGFEVDRKYNLRYIDIEISPHVDVLPGEALPHEGPQYIM